MHTLHQADLKNKKVFYRADYNVPFENGEISDDFRILASKPTLDYMMEQGARIIIGTHLGRPDGHRIAQFELRPVDERLAELYPKCTVRLAHEVQAPEVDQAVAAMRPGDILLLPNLRFYPEEEGNNEAFSRQLASLADVYVNDAFACDHRAHASIVGVPSFLPHYAGFLLEAEVKNLTHLMQHPAKPFVVIMGGAKVSDKIEVIEILAAKADYLLIGGAMANTFLLAKGEDISQSKAEKDKVQLAESLLEKFGEKIVLASDYVKDSIDDNHFRYLDIGPDAV